jgi:long-chain acyl-CoA synthetase
MGPGVHSGERSVPYAELLRHAGQFARGYDGLGVGAGDSVAVLLRNDPSFLEASLGTVVLGANPVPINWHWHAQEVGYLLRDCEAKALVVHDDLLGAIARAVPDGVEVIGVPTPAEVCAAYGLTAPAPADAHRYERWLDELKPWDQAPEQAPSSVIYTSGTTGRPKGVVRDPQTDEGREATNVVVEHIFGLGEGAVTVIPAPMYHTAPNVYALGAAVRGLDMTLMPRFDPEDFLRIVERRRVTTVQMVPTMFVRLLQLPEDVRARYDVSSLEFVVHAAAPCAPEIKRAMIDWFGPIVTEYYGSTETGAVVFCTSEEWLAHPGTVGRALPNATVKVLRDDGAEAATGESGEVYVRLHTWPDFTYRGDEAKRASIEHDGLVTSGDIGYLDADGYLYLNDRRNDMIISGGVNIYPAEIEACLIGLEGVLDCAVFGIPDERMGEAVCAHVHHDPGAALTEDAVRDHVAASLARYKVPRVVVLTDELPREDSGKVFKRLLKEPYWAGRERAI